MDHVLPHFATQPSATIDEKSSSAAADIYTLESVMRRQKPPPARPGKGLQNRPPGGRVILATGIAGEFWLISRGPQPSAPIDEKSPTRANDWLFSWRVVGGRLTERCGQEGGMTPDCRHDGNQLAPGALGAQPAAHLPPCSVGYPGRSREWLRPCLFGALPQIVPRGPAGRGCGHREGLRT